jgi:excisionase family DNA binding protein
VTDSDPSLEGDSISVSEAARLLGVHKNTVRHRIKIGALPAHKTLTAYGEAYMIPRAALDLPAQDPSKPLYDDWTPTPLSHLMTSLPGNWPRCSNRSSCGRYWSPLYGRLDRSARNSARRRSSATVRSHGSPTSRPGSRQPKRRRQSTRPRPQSPPRSANPCGGAFLASSDLLLDNFCTTFQARGTGAFPSLYHAASLSITRYIGTCFAPKPGLGAIRSRDVGHDT